MTTMKAKSMLHTVFGAACALLFLGSVGTAAAQSASPKAGHDDVNQGLVILYGINTPVDLNAADACFTKAMAQKDPCGEFWHAQLLDRFADDDYRDWDREIYSSGALVRNELANQGDELSRLTADVFAVIYGRRADRAEGVNDLSALAAQNNVVAATEYAHALMSRRVGAAANQQAFNLLKGLADKNNARAMFYLACCYNAGIGTGRDTTMGRKLLKEAASKGVPEAVKILRGRDVDDDEDFDAFDRDFDFDDIFDRDDDDDDD